MTGKKWCTFCGVSGHLADSCPRAKEFRESQQRRTIRMGPGTITMDGVMREVAGLTVTLGEPEPCHPDPSTTMTLEIPLPVPLEWTEHQPRLVEGSAVLLKGFGDKDGVYKVGRPYAGHPEHLAHVEREIILEIETVRGKPDEPVISFRTEK